VILDAVAEAAAKRQLRLLEHQAQQLGKAVWGG
jgi:hypothetical protein